MTFANKLHLSSVRVCIFQSVWEFHIGPLSGDVSGKFTTSTDKQEGGVCLGVYVSCIPIGNTEHDELTAS